MNTINQVNTTLKQTMSLLDLSYQINKQSTKATVEWAKSFGNDLSNDIMNGIRKMHKENINKESPQDPEMMFSMFQEIIQDALEERIELLKLDIPTRKRGRVSKKKPAVKDVVAVEDSDDEAPKKRGRKKNAVVEETTVDAMNNLGLSTSNDEAPKKKRAPKPKSVKGFKVFRRIEKMAEKPKGSGKFKKSTPWRKTEYELKEGEKWLDTWSIAEKAPKRGSLTFDHKPTDEEFANFKPDMAQTASKPAKKSAKKTVEKPVLKKQPTLIENPEEVKEATEVKDQVKELVEEQELEVEQQLEEEEYEDEDEEQIVEEKLPATVSNFTPSGDYEPFTAIDGQDNLIYYTNKDRKQYGMIVDLETGKPMGWIADEEADDMCDNRPIYDHEEDDEDEENWESMVDGNMNDFMM